MIFKNIAESAYHAGVSPSQLKAVLSHVLSDGSVKLTCDYLGDMIERTEESGKLYIASLYGFTCKDEFDN